MNTLQRACFCGNTTGIHLGDVDFTTYTNHLLPSTHRLTACEACGFVFADFESDQSVFDKYYEYFSKYEDASLSADNISSDKYKTQENIANFIETNLKINKDAHLIDIGCALGGQLKYLQNLNYRNLYGLDPSKKCVDICNQMGITAFKGSGARNDIDRSFDVILMDNVLEHVYDIKDFFQTVIGMLKPEGYLVVRVPDARLYTPAFYEKAYSAFTIEHINHFDHQSLIRVGTLNNLSIVSTGIDPSDPSGVSIVYKKVQNTGYLNAQKACETYLKQSAKILDETKEKLKNKLSNNKIAIWGIGSYYSRLSAISFFNGFKIIALVDKDKHKQNRSIGPESIISPEKLKSINESFTIIVCAEKNGNSIISNIEKLNLNREIVAI